MPEHIRQEPKVLVSTENLTEQEWLAYRRQGDRRQRCRRNPRHFSVPHRPRPVR